MKDRILFWIDQTLLDFGTAKFLQSKHECELFAIVDVTDRTKIFFRHQELVPFSKIWYYHDHFGKKINPNIEYLQAFEQKYHINLWTLAYNERIFYRFNDYYKFTEDEVLSILEQECRLYEEILDEVQPDFVIMSQPPFHHNYLFYKICRSRNISVLILKPVRIGYKCMIANDDELLDYKKRTSFVSRTFKELLEYHSNFNIHKQNTEFEQKFQKSRIGFLNAIIQFLFVSNNSNTKTHYTYYGRTKLKVLLKSIVYSLKTKYRKSFIDRNLSRVVKDDSKFVYFPLHIEEERSLLLLAPFYTNQIETITNIAQSLPIGYKLYLKEHPMMFTRAWRPIHDYKKIINLPNVKLLHPSVSHKDLLEKCSLVITISGTSSFDAAIFQKPSIVFVDTAFSTLPSVFRLKSPEDLPNIINQALKTNVDVKDLSEYISYIEEVSFDFDFDGLVQTIADSFYYSGSLVDVEIPVNKMKSFLELHAQKFEILASEFMKQINKNKKA